MRAGQTVDVRIERGPDSLDVRVVPPMLRGTRYPYESKPRGRVRLVVRMPPPPIRPLGVVLVSVSAFAAVYLFVSDQAGGPQFSAAAFSAGLVLAGLVIWLLAYASPGSPEELVIDSRLVSVTRGGRLRRWAHRRHVDAVWALAVPVFMDVLAARPRIGLGASGHAFISVGAGLSAHATQEIVAAVEQFLLDVAPDEG